MDAAVLPESWCVATLNDIARPFGGSTPSKSDASFWTDGTVPWVSPKDMKVFELRGSEDLVSEKALARLSLIPEGSVLVVVRSGILSRILPVAINHLPVTINQDMRAFVPAPEISARFIAWQLLANQREILGKCSKDGTTVASIEAVALASYPFALPPAAEQHRIVAKIEELFSELDQGVASLKTAREQLKVYRQSLLKNAFAGKLTAVWRAAHPDQLETAAALQQRIAREREARHQQQLADWQAANQQGPKPKPPKPLPPLAAEELAELPELPEGWGWFSLNQISDSISDGDHQAPPQTAEGVPFITISDIKNQQIDFSDTRFVSQAYFDALSELRRPKRGDVLYSVTGSFGIPCLVDFDRDFCFQRHVALVRTGQHISKKYLFYVLSSRFSFSQAAAVATGTAQKTVPLSGLRAMKIPFMSSREQEQIAQELESKLSEADQLDQTLATALQQADALRQSILKKAFCGQLEKQDKNEEPATALLERIRAGKSNGMKKPAKRGRFG